GVCPSSAPVSLSACVEPVGCPFAKQCCYCAPGVACAAGPMAWYCTVVPAVPGCPAASPPDGASCTGALRCVYCDPRGLLNAQCTGGSWKIAFADVDCLGK